MENLNVKRVAKKLNTKADFLITKLKLLGIEATATSRLDEFTILKVYLLLIEKPRVEDVADTFHLTTGKVIKKFETLGVSLFSKFSTIKEKDLIKFLNSKDLYSLIQSPKPAKKSPKRQNGDLENLNVKRVAKNLNTKADFLITKLKLLGIEATATSRLDEFTILKVYLLLIENPRIEDVAEILHLNTAKVIEKFEKLGVNLFSKISIIKEGDLIKFLNSKDLYSLIKTSRETKKQKLQSKKKEKVIKFTRLDEAAQKLGVGEETLKSHLKEMHIFVQSSKTPIDDKTMKMLVKKILHSTSISYIASSKARNLFKPFVAVFNFVTGNTIFTGTIAVLCIIYLTVLSGISYFKAVNYPRLKITGLQMPIYQEINKVTGKVGYLEVHKSDLKVPIAFEGSDVSYLTPTLFKMKGSPRLGNRGISILSDEIGNTYKAFEDLVPGDVLVIKTKSQTLFYKVTAFNLDNIDSLPLKAALIIKVQQFDKLIELRAILQKQDF